MSKRVRAPRQLALTREGLGVLGLSMLVGLAALNTGANLLFMVLGLLAATLLHSLVASARVLRGLRVEFELPRLIEAGRDWTATLRVYAPVPSATGSIVIEGSRFLPASGLYLERLPAGDGTAAIPFPARAPGRGMVEALEVDLITRAPFHLIARRRRLQLPAGVAVHPRLGPPRPPVWAGVASGGGETSRAGDGGSVRDLRPYAAGDNPRHIHWRASARTGDLVVREFHAEASPRAQVILDPDPAAGVEVFEQAVAAAASAVRDALVAGFGVDLLAPGERLSFEGPQDLERALRWFARLAVPGSPV